MSCGRSSWIVLVKMKSSGKRNLGHGHCAECLPHLKVSETPAEKEKGCVTLPFNPSLTVTILCHDAATSPESPSEMWAENRQMENLSRVLRNKA